MIYLVVKRLATPFTDWDAYKFGIIDDKGKKIKDPKTSEEREAWTLFDRLIWNIRKILTKFVGHSRLAAILTTAYLLKDSMSVLLKHESFLLEHQSEIKEMTAAQQQAIFELVKLMDSKLILVEGEETENGLYRHANNVASFVDDEEIQRIFKL